MSEKLGSYQNFSLPNINGPVACFMPAALMQHNWGQYKFRQFNNKPVNLKPLIEIFAPQIISSLFQKNLLLESPVYPCPDDPRALAIANRLQLYKLPRPKSIEQLVGFKKHLGLEPVSFRVSGCWMGSADVEKANYVTPPPQFIDPMMQDVFSFLRSGLVPGHVSSLLVTLWIAKIHPFSDSNGRLLRSWLLCNGSYMDFVLASVMATARMELIQLWDECVNGDLIKYIEMFGEVAQSLNSDIVKCAYECKKMTSDMGSQDSNLYRSKYVHDILVTSRDIFLNVDH